MPHTSTSAVDVFRKTKALGGYYVLAMLGDDNTQDTTHAIRGAYG